MNANSGFMHISEILPGVLKEISQRTELRLRLEAEWGRLLTDEEFLIVAERSGARL